ncbi:uncharacterized protein FTOL_07310 [Fusarium torulosum]|uniref:Uncharacterized protein n=1 Tax=Fusarium torulosum TaxID=33205 RepID=A0AAE8MAL2_9HYPO|nr:uncharacterized protein FTOL_07310 [Fusarium torulosum]
MSHLANIDELSNHQIQEHEFVLLVRRPGALEYRNRRLRGSDHPVKAYGDRSAADQGTGFGKTRAGAAATLAMQAKPGNSAQVPRTPRLTTSPTASIAETKLRSTDTTRARLLEILDVADISSSFGLQYEPGGG